MFQSIILAASAVALVSAQGPPPAAPAGCTTLSFVIPSWVIREFKSTAGSTTFQVWNRATNNTVEVACKESACDVKGESDLVASIRTLGTSAQVSLNETWVCKDRNGSEKFPFTAVGHNSVAYTYVDGTYTANNPQVLVRGSLLSPVAATPTYQEGPTGHDAPGCRAGSETPSWALSNIHLVDQDGDGINAVPATSFNLAIVNTANGYQASCMADTVDEGSSIINLFCAGYEFQSFTIGRYSLSTSGTFDKATNTLSLNQTWYCDDTDPGRPVALRGSASSVLPLTCTTDKVHGNYTRKTCVLKESKLTGKLLSEESLPAFSVEDPQPGADGCTISSIFKPQWSLSAFAIDGKTGPATASAEQTVSFNIILATGSRGFQYPISVSQGKALTDGWYECDVGPDGEQGPPLFPYKCSLKWDGEGKVLSLKADWKCVDLDGENPTHFSGVTTTKVNDAIACETEGEALRCQTSDPGYTWTADITDVKWSSKP
ncbi:hypothetical protein OQA88_11565 [Cercophora sp. LCS_1]